MQSLDPVFPLLARGVLVLLFVGAVRHKLADPLRFEGIVANYRLAPARASAVLARGLVALEIALVAGLVAPWTAPAAAIAAALVLSAYGLAIGVNLARGRGEIECGCGGPGERLRPRLLLRNALLVGVCLFAAAPAASRALGALDLVTVAAGLGALALLGSAGGRLAAVGGTSADGETA
ncbi:MAG: MauE/DoxX family redox-associated membrane protein [Myxococcota bacterium]